MSVKLTPIEELVIEVLVARYRLGEELWTFSSKPAITKAAQKLADMGFVWRMNGMVERTFRAGLTDQGREEFTDSTYLSPAEKKWLKADPEKVIEAVRRLFDAS